MPARDTEFRLYGEPRPVPLDEALAGPATALLVTGVVNPMGPTLTAFVADGELRQGTVLPVARLMLNPFRQEAEVVGELALADSWQPAAVIRSLFVLSSGGCPTLLLPSAHLDDEASVPLHTELLSRFEDARETLDLLRQYPGNPWDRVSRQMGTACDAAARPGGPLDEVEATELAELLLSEQHAGPELQAFFYAWGGSSNFQRKQGLPALADGAMGLDTFRGIFLRLAQTCRAPEADDEPPENPFTELREAAEAAFHQGYKVRDRAKTEEALTALLARLFELFGESLQFFQFFGILDQVNRAVEAGDWEGGKAPLLAVLARLRQAEASGNEGQG